MADITPTVGSVLAVSDPTYSNVTAGATITAGALVYLDAADSDKAKLCDNGALATARCAGIALHAALSGQPLKIQTAGVIALGSVLTAGETYVVSNDAGGLLHPIADIGTGEFVTIMGVALTTSQLRLLIYPSGVAHA